MMDVMTNSAHSHNQFVGDAGNAVLAGVIQGGVHIHDVTDQPGTEPVYMTVSVTEFVGDACMAVVDGESSPTIPVSGRHLVRVLVEGRGRRAVILNALRPVVIHRVAPRPARPGPAARGKLSQHHFDVLLDEDPARLAPRAAGFPFTVSSTDPEQFLLRPLVAAHEAEWQLELDWTCAGRTGTTVIDNGGRPFRVYPAIPKLAHACR